MLAKPGFIEGFESLRGVEPAEAFTGISKQAGMPNATLVTPRLFKNSRLFIILARVDKFR